MIYLYEHHVGFDPSRVVYQALAAARAFCCTPMPDYTDITPWEEKVTQGPKSGGWVREVRSSNMRSPRPFINSTAPASFRGEVMRELDQDGGLGEG